MNVYFVRHGMSVGNLKNIHQGTDIPLTKQGKKQAKLIAKRLKNLEIDVIYSSPYKRAKDTAKEISKELKLPVEYWDEIRERKRSSELEGLRYDSFEASKIEKIIRENRNKADWKYSDDESFNDLKIRAEKVERHLLKHHKNQNVLCVSHLGIMKMIMMNIILKDTLTPEVFWQFYYHSMSDNTGITYIKHTREYGWELICWNDTTHL